LTQLRNLDKMIIYLVERMMGGTMKKYDVTALGELLIDFTENSFSENGNPLLEANPGGAPGNVLAILSSLGKKTAFIGKVGADNFGRMLKKIASEIGIDTSGIIETPDIPTTLAFVHTLPDGDREFSFYRCPGADVTLCEDDLNVDIIRNSTIFHFGTLSMTEPACQGATKKAVEIAKQSGAIISFDPNLRMSLWRDLDNLRESVIYGLTLCDVLKISDNEIEWLTGSSDYKSTAIALQKQYNIPLIFVTLGKDGSMVLSHNTFAKHSGYKVNTIEATGAGDTFFGAVLSYISRDGIIDYSESELYEMLRFGNAAAAIITTRPGAMKVMPEREEIEELINK